MLYPTECSICRELPEFIPAHADERSMTTMISNPGARGSFVLYRPSSRSSWSSSSSPSPAPLFSRSPALYSRYTHTGATVRSPACYINLKKSTHSWETVANQAPIQYIATRPRHFPGSRTGMIFQGFVCVSAAIRFPRIARYPIRLRAILRAVTSIARKRRDHSWTLRAVRLFIPKRSERIITNELIYMNFSSLISGFAGSII